MKSLTLIAGIFAILWAIQSSAVPRDQVLHKVMCRGFSYDWQITVYQDSQFGLVQMTGEELINGVDANVGFGFPVVLTTQASGFTVTSDLVNSDGSQDSFSLDAQHGRLTIQNVVDHKTNTLVGPIDQELVCGAL